MLIEDRADDTTYPTSDALYKKKMKIKRRNKWYEGWYKDNDTTSM